MTTSAGVAAAPPLRVGILVDPGPQAWWIAELLRELVRDGTIQLVLVVRGDVPPADVAQGSRWGRRLRYGLFALHARLDERFFGGGFDPLHAVPIDDVTAGVTMLDVVPQRTRFSDTFAPADVDAVRAAGCDVLLRFGFRILRGDVLRAARYGVWSYHHGDNRVNRGGPPGFWESLLGEPVTGATLQVLSEALDGGRAIGRAWTATDLLSPLRNRRALYRQAMALLPRALRIVRARGDEGLDALAPDSGWTAYDRPLFRVPTSSEMLPLLARRIARSVASRWRSFWNRERWGLAMWRHAYHEQDPNAPDGVVYRARLVPSPKDRYWADPFCVRTGDGWTVFFEELPDATRRGVIAAVEVAADGTWGVPRCVLDLPYHLSYPFVFEDGGVWYMVPESHDTGRVDLFRAVEFPWKWEREATLIDNMSLVDATLHRHEGRWWLFGCVAPHGASPSEQLHLFSAPSLRGPWASHPANPICLDVRRARPAGRLFTSGGRLFRPAQDCSWSYGSAIVMHEVVRLDAAQYVEVVVDRLDPIWRRDLAGLHTLNSDRGLTVIDVRRRVRRWMR